MIIFTVLTVILLFLSGGGIFFFEYKAQPEVFKSIFDSIWWAIESLTSVGYRDIYPITAGFIASALSRARDTKQSVKNYYAYCPTNWSCGL